MSSANPSIHHPRSLRELIKAVHLGAADSSHISGATHGFYRYPARFSPVFARSAIEAFSKPGEIVLDPFMGGATTVVEAFATGRRALGSDINALAVFIARVKCTPLTGSQQLRVSSWAERTIPRLKFSETLDDSESVDDARLRNLHIPRARPLKKLIALAIDSLAEVENIEERRFIRCALLSTGQWALNGRRNAVSCLEFRAELNQRIRKMLRDIQEFSKSLAGILNHKPRVVLSDIEDLPHSTLFANAEKADLVVTSPPYPGIHMLYHRWQVDGRKESPAPYWISATKDGQGSAFYNMGDRRDPRSCDYFENMSVGLRSLRMCVRNGGTVVQMLAFAKPKRDLPRYLLAMESAGFVELNYRNPTGALARRFWRDVPNRAWHASRKGATSSSREVVLIHRAD
jgi:DNA modification methylase